MLGVFLVAFVAAVLLFPFVIVLGDTLAAIETAIYKRWGARVSETFALATITSPLWGVFLYILWDATHWK